MVQKLAILQIIVMLLVGQSSLYILVTTYFIKFIKPYEKHC